MKFILGAKTLRERSEQKLRARWLTPGIFDMSASFRSLVNFGRVCRLKKQWILLTDGGIFRKNFQKI